MYKFENHIFPRKDIPLKNRFTLEESSRDYTVVLYYISQYKCRAIVRRFDGYSLPDEKIKLTLYSLEQTMSKYEVPLGDSIIETTISLYPIDLEYPQQIPKTIIQTAEQNMCMDDIGYNKFMTLLEINPEYEYIFYNDQDRRAFIKDNYSSDVLRAYDTLVAGAYKADLFRYCYLYVYGGCYLDYKIIARKPLRQLIAENDMFITCIDYDRGNTLDKNRDTTKSYLNALIFSTPRNETILQMVLACTKNILDMKEYFFNSRDTKGYADILNITGPTLFYTVCTTGNGTSKQSLKFKHLIKNNDESSYKNFQIIDYETGEVSFTKTHLTNDMANHYSKLWERRELFYVYAGCGKNFLFFVYPTSFSDTFRIEYDNNKLRVLRTDTPQGWGLDLRIKIVDDKASRSSVIRIGPHHTSEKVIDFFI